MLLTACPPSNRCPSGTLALGFRVQVCWKTSENTAPIRGIGLAAGDMPDTGNGLYAPRRAVDHRGARLLPDDARPMRSDGHARFSWLLSQGSTERLRWRSGHKSSDFERCCDRRYLAYFVRVAESGIFCHRMGWTPRLLAARIPAFNHLHPEDLVRSTLALGPRRALIHVCAPLSISNAI